MKTYFLKTAYVLMLATFIMGCKDKANEANTSEAEAALVAEANTDTYITDVTASVIEWKGFKPTGTHFGTVKIDNGVFKLTDGNIQSGTFLIDMTSIESKDLEAGSQMKANLENHLKGTVEGKEGDFFNVTKFPSAAFEITGIEALEQGKHMLSGNLSVKGVKNNISFPVSISNDGNLLTIASDAFTIDRTKWNVNYQSKSVFDNLGDKFINDDMEIKITIKAAKS